MRDAAAKVSTPQATPQTIRLHVPVGTGGFWGGGQMLRADADGTISVPPEQVHAVLAPGYTRADDAKATSAAA